MSFVVQASVSLRLQALSRVCSIFLIFAGFFFNLNSSTLSVCAIVFGVMLNFPMVIQYSWENIRRHRIQIYIIIKRFTASTVKTISLKKSFGKISTQFRIIWFNSKFFLFPSLFLSLPLSLCVSAPLFCYFFYLSPCYCYCRNFPCTYSTNDTANMRRTTINNVHKYSPREMNCAFKNRGTVEIKPLSISSALLFSSEQIFSRFILVRLLSYFSFTLSFIHSLCVRCYTVSLILLSIQPSSQFFTLLFIGACV